MGHSKRIVKLALGYASKAKHRDGAERELMKVPATEDFERWARTSIKEVDA